MGFPDQQKSLPVTLSTNSTIFAIDPLTEHAKDENKKAPDMKTTFSKKKKKKKGGDCKT